MPSTPRIVRTVSRTLPILGSIAALAIGPASAQQADTRPVVSLHVRGVHLTDGNPSGVAAGVEVRGAGSTYLFGGVDAYVFKLRDEAPSGWRAPAGTHVHALPLRAPRLTAGVGQRLRAGGATLSGEAYVGQQTVTELAPLAGGAVALEHRPWAVTVDGVMRRATTYELGTPPAPSLPADATPVGHRWLPSLEVGARWDVGTLGRAVVPPTRDGGGRGLGRPIIGGVAGVALGIPVGMAAALPAVAACKGDESCLLPVLAGAVIGESVGVPFGVHVAEGRRGNLFLSTLASVGITGLGMAAIGYVGDSGTPPVAVSVLVPIAQIAASTYIERRTRRR
jgi:hypothetical protein